MNALKQFAMFLFTVFMLLALVGMFAVVKFFERLTERDDGVQLLTMVFR